jgi:hypothetical protein
MPRSPRSPDPPQSLPGRLHHPARAPHGHHGCHRDPSRAGELAALLRRQALAGLWRHSARSRHLRARADGCGCCTVHILRCTVPHPHPNPRPVPGQRAGGRPGAGGTSQALAGRAPERAGHRSGPPGSRGPSSRGPGSILTGRGTNPRCSLIVASMVKRRRAFSQSAYGTGMHRLRHGARIQPIWLTAGTQVLLRHTRTRGL